MQAMADWENFAVQGQPLKMSINVPLSGCPQAARLKAPPHLPTRK
jgi:hypothetical protein